MPEWIWAVAGALACAATVALAARARQRRRPHAPVILGTVVIGCVLLAALFVADALVQQWTDPTVRFARGCVAGLGVGAILGALGLLATHVRSGHQR